ncbi:MAG: hypothetical protein M8835_03480 [marine benthic group bacterium]|jgi:hypothetical protein|nr:hypothetical protein [Gemmatimonadota bacterium]MCL7973598.1 hypothetical protein [Gemmatimonadota bacterium]MCL7984589.1 hypothetical protein [Gemmatimonadota bacterium]MCL7992252.1 hypothetical protein [Gemmatimonadota bacterium]
MYSIYAVLSPPQALGEYGGANFVRELSRNLFSMVMDNIWYIVGGLAAVIVLWLYVRR